MSSPVRTGGAPVEAGSKPALPASEPASVPDRESAWPATTGDPALAPVPPLAGSGAGNSSALNVENSEPWKGTPVPDGFSLNRSGVWQSDTGSRLSGPLWLAAGTFDTTCGDHGVVIRWIDVRHSPRELAVTRDELHAFGSSLPSRLARAGLRYTPGDDRRVLKYLAAFDPDQLPLWNSVSRVGWTEEPEGGLAYMLPPPTGLIALGHRTPVVFQPERESPSSASIYARGSLEEWNRQIVAPCAKNPLLLFPILVALAAPLLRFAEAESGGFHYYGRSSHGKTTAAQIGASVWGNGADPAEAPDRSYVQKWNTTQNAFEALLSAHNDGLLVLDEIHTCEAKDFGTVLYNLAGGVGKQALDRDRQLRRPRKWRAMYFSTGEISVTQKLEAEGRTPHAGQLLRLIDIPIEGGVIVHTGNQSPASLADRLKKACARCFGVAGPEFIRHLVGEYADASQLTGTVRAMMERHAIDLIPPNAPPEHGRAIKRFALVQTAGELAVKLGVLECTMQDVESAVLTAVRAWQTDGANVPDRLRGVLNVQAFMERNEARFQKPGDESRLVPQNRAGYIGTDNATGAQCHFFSSDGLREACDGQSPRDTANELLRLGFLLARERGRLTEKRNFEIGRPRVYVVRSSLLGFDPSADREPDSGATGASGQPEKR